jgi:hypothetical protein
VILLKRGGHVMRNDANDSARNFGQNKIQKSGGMTMSD